MSSDSCFLASLIIFSTSESDKPLDASILMLCSLPVALSLALTLSIPFASISKVTSICGTPLGDGGISARVNLPIVLLSQPFLFHLVKRISTVVWLSAAVLKTCDFFVGIVVFLSIKVVETLPRVSIPNERGVTSKSNTSSTSPDNTPP